jgi:hypothetical protein
MPRIALVFAAGLAGLALAAPLSGKAEPGSRPVGKLVFLERGNRFVSIDVATGRRTVRRVSGVASCAPQLQTTGGHVIFSAVRRRQTVVYSVPVSLDERPRLLGAAHAFVPSATEGRVWLAGVDCDRPRMVGVREVTVDGRVTFRSDRRVPGGWLTGAIEDGLVLQGRRARVWDPRTGRTSDRIDMGVLDTDRGLMAGCASASRCRELAIFDAATSRKTTARARAPHRLDPAARFSPDGSVLAATIGARRQWSVALVDPRDGSTEIVPGSSTGTTYPSLTWASSGWLFFRGRGDRIMGFRPGERRAVTLPFRWPRRAVTFVGG